MAGLTKIKANSASQQSWSWSWGLAELGNKGGSCPLHISNVINISFGMVQEDSTVPSPPIFLANLPVIVPIESCRGSVIQYVRDLV